MNMGILLYIQLNLNLQLKNVYYVKNLNLRYFLMKKEISFYYEPSFIKL